MKHLVLIAALSLSACASYEGLQSSPVDRVVSSSKSVDAFVGCVSRKVGKAPIPSEDGAPMIAVTNAYGSPLAVFTFREAPSGSIAEVRQSSGLAATGFVEDCA